MIKKKQVIKKIKKKDPPKKRRKNSVLRTARRKKAMIEALTDSLGIITIAAKKLGITRQTHYDWYKRDEKYKKAVDDIAEVALDFAESMLHKQIQDKDTIATIFYLKTKGKRRGYIEKQDIDVTFGGKSFLELIQKATSDDSGDSGKG